mmetsp:Transcript_11014/g.32566  ORF Transcript_11014/g.32566 Transcript_11014/m.32566 type:complete len:281 (+) Transcript_11014:55-897(+)
MRDAASSAAVAAAKSRMTRAIARDVPLWGVLCSDSSLAFARSLRNRRSSWRFLSRNSFRFERWQGMTAGSGDGERSSGGGVRRLLASGSGEGTRVTPDASRGGAGAVGGLLASGPTDNTRATPGDVARSTLGIGGGGDTGATLLLARTGEYGLLGLLARRTTLGVGAARSSATATSAAASAAFASGSSGSDAPTAWAYTLDNATTCRGSLAKESASANAARKALSCTSPLSLLEAMVWFGTKCWPEMRANVGGGGGGSSFVGELAASFGAARARSLLYSE